MHFLIDEENLIFFFISVPVSKLQRLGGFVAFFEKIYDGEPSYRIFLLSGRMYSTVVSIMSTRMWQPDTVQLFENNFLFQLTETGFAEKI
jgi:hypothetical protein